MKILIHRRAKFPLKVISYNSEKVHLRSKTCTAAFWELAEKFPDEVIGWCEEEFQDNLAPESWAGIFHHDLIMASYAVKTAFLPPAIGYVDQLPFININREVLYGTWRMSADIGGITGKVLLKFKPVFGKIKSFQYLLNCIAKIGQQNGLFCYSAPGLVDISGKRELTYTAGNDELYNFVSQHYKLFRSIILLWCMARYEQKYPVKSFLLSLVIRSYFQKKVDLSDVIINSAKTKASSSSVDVIIPTMDRPGYLLQVLEDLSAQSLLPRNVIIVEQNPNRGSVSDLSELHQKNWPFKIVHHFIHQTGACNARNLALKEVTANWVFFCDDDNRFRPDLLETAMQEISNYGLEMLNTAYLQPDEEPIYKKVKQWGTFGSGNAIVKAEHLQGLIFDLAFENGYGEDKDFGMQLRNKGVDIIYHPGVEIVHLKAPMGGFREAPEFPWTKEETEPKPSPTLMVYAKKYFTKEQLRGYKTAMFIKYYRGQSIRNPFSYIRKMRKRWKSSETWAEYLMMGTDKK